MKIAVCVVLLLVAASAVLAAKNHFGTPAGKHLYSVYLCTFFVHLCVSACIACAYAVLYAWSVMPARTVMLQYAIHIYLQAAFVSVL